MKVKYAVFASVFLLIFLSSVFAKSDYYKDRDILIQIVKEVCRSYEERNVEKLMSFWSKKSPDYKKTKNDLKKIFNDFEDIKVIFSYRGSPQVVFKKSEATVIVQNKVTAKYIVRYPYREKGDKVKFTWKKDKDGKYKIVKIKIIKEKKKKDEKKQQRIRALSRQKEKVIIQKFKTKDEEKIAKLSEEAINCISKKDINCFLKYNNCSFPLGYIRCKFFGIMFNIMEERMKEEDIKISVDKSKRINITTGKNKITTVVNTITDGKYKLTYPFNLDQKMTVILRKENGTWKIWKSIIIDKAEESKKTHEHKNEK